MMNSARTPVLVLGASGFIGSRVVAALAASPTWQPIAASRRAARDPHGLVLDATNPAEVKAAVRSAGLVVNCIAGNERDMIRATEILCEATPERIVHLSSMAVYGAAIGLVDEDHASVSPLSGYGEAKRTCEQILRQSAVKAVILRPTCVFGPGSSQWTTRIARLLRAHRLGDLGRAGDGYCNLAYVDDVVAATISALTMPSGAGRTFNVNSSAELTWNAFLLRFARALDAVPVRRIPERTLRLETKLLAPARRVASKFIRSSLTEAITPSLAGLFQQTIRVDNTAAINDLGLRPTSVERMIAEAVRWLHTAEHRPISPQSPVAATRS